MLEYEGTTQHPTRNPGPRRRLLHPDTVLAPLTCRRKRSASAALPAAMHWKEAFWPALTSTSPRREKCGAFAVGIEPPCELGLCPATGRSHGHHTPHPAPPWAGTHRRGS